MYSFSRIILRNMCQNRSVKPAYFNDVINKYNYIIDVREPSELIDDGKIDNSVNIPLAEFENALKLSNDEFLMKYGRNKPDYNDDIILTCKAGKRSQLAAEMAIKYHFKNIRSYNGGWLDYNENMQKK